MIKSIRSPQSTALLCAYPSVQIPGFREHITDFQEAKCDIEDAFSKYLNYAAEILWD